MPRGDKQHILDYKIILPSLDKQQKIVSEIEKIEKQIEILEQELSEIPSKKVDSEPYHQRRYAPARFGCYQGRPQGRRRARGGIRY